MTRPDPRDPREPRPPRVPDREARAPRPTRDELRALATPDAMVEQLASHRDWRTVLDTAEAEEETRTDRREDTLTEIRRLRAEALADIADIESDYEALYGEAPPIRIRRRGR